MAHSPRTIPTFYRVFFIYLDPVMSLWAAYACFADPDLLLDSYVPKTISVRNPLHDALFHQLGGAFFYIAMSQAVLLSYTNDVNIWKIVHGGLLGWDLAILYGIWNGLSVQGRLDPGVWRMEDWITVGSTLVIGLARAAVVAGIGLRKIGDNGKGKTG